MGVKKTVELNCDVCGSHVVPTACRVLPDRRGSFYSTTEGLFWYSIEDRVFCPTCARKLVQLYAHAKEGT